MVCLLMCEEDCVEACKAVADVSVERVVVRCVNVVDHKSCIRKGEMVGSPLHKVGQGM